VKGDVAKITNFLLEAHQTAWLRGLVRGVVGVFGKGGGHHS
ncbi:MAG: hypothetical protein RLZZ538_1232, partial [Actinomycetota bacterium]